MYVERNRRERERLLKIRELKFDTIQAITKPVIARIV